MPELARFLGIVIDMFYREHGVPHIHAVYGEHEIKATDQYRHRVSCRGPSAGGSHGRG